MKHLILLLLLCVGGVQAQTVSPLIALTKIYGDEITLKQMTALIADNAVGDMGNYDYGAKVVGSQLDAAQMEILTQAVSASVVWFKHYYTLQQQGVPLVPDYMKGAIVGSMASLVFCSVAFVSTIYGVWAYQNNVIVNNQMLLNETYEKLDICLESCQ